MTTGQRICLVTSTHVSANPRLVKEADALLEAGFDVTVVAIDMNEELRRLDQAVLHSHRWKIRNVHRGTLFLYAVRTIVHRASRFFLAITGLKNVWLARLAHHRLDARLSRSAGKIPADLYLAHTLAALAPAAAAARKNGARLGFDAEDFHTEELTAAQRNPGDQVAREVIERSLFPRCDHLTAASPLIAEAYRKQYGVEAQTILNVFPTSEAPTKPLSPAECPPRSMYWFSQTIGEGRGLEAILEAISYLEEPATLWLRGNPAPGYEQQLRSLAEQFGVGPCLNILPVSPPDTMTRVAQPYQLGLAVEPGVSFNNQIALSNKAFTYVLAGVPVLFSRTPAQEALAAEFGEASLLVDLNQPREVAGVLDAFFRDGSLRERARRKAWQLGRERYNWDIEKLKFLDYLRKALAGTGRTSGVRRFDPNVSHFLPTRRDHSVSGQLQHRRDAAPPGFDIPILLYHHLVGGDVVDPSAYEISIRQFEQQLDLLAEWKFSIINFATLLRMMDGTQPRRERVAIITFDDAFRSFFELGLPALERRGMSATVFVPAGEMGGKNRWDAASGLPERAVMNEGEVRESAMRGIEIGSHGWVHRSLPDCSEAEAEEELHRSRDRLATLGLPPRVFAYPYGHYSPKNTAMVRDAGYEAAVSIFSPAPTVTGDRFAMRRIYLHPGDSPWRFRCKLSRAYLRYTARRGTPKQEIAAGR